MTKDEVVEAFIATRNREAMAQLLMRLRRLDVDRALYLFEGFADKLLDDSYAKGYAAAQTEFVEGLG